MKAPEILAAFPIAALAAAILFLISGLSRRLRWVALAWSVAVLPALAVITYRLWDHYVGPDTFAFWRFNLSPANMPVLLPLAVVSPLLLLACEGNDLSKGRNAGVSALSCLALGAAMTAILSDHFFLLIGSFAVATLCLGGSTVLRKKGRRLRSIALIPLAISDLCLALGVLFIYLDDYGRGLFFPTVPLNPNGKLAAACALMLAAALLRLGGFPLHRWISRAGEGGKDIRLVHLLAVDLVLGAYLLYMTTQVFFKWSGAWVWICFGAGALTLVVVLRGLLNSSRGSEAWGLLCAAAGAHIALSASPATQMSAVAVRFGVFAAISMLALVEMGSDSGISNAWARATGGMGLRGLPPLAGFAWRWMEFQVLILAFGSGSRLLFVAALPLVFAGVLIEGFRPLTWPSGQTEKAPGFALVASSILLAVFGLALGLYPGSFVDLLMREYGISVNLPFPGWTSLGWAILICSSLAILILYLLHRGREKGRDAFSSGALPLLAGGGPLVLPGQKILENRAFGAAILALLFGSWAAVLIFLALK